MVESKKIKTALVSVYHKENLDEIIIKSDNPEYRIRTISGQTINDLILVGKIVGIIKTIN